MVKITQEGRRTDSRGAHTASGACHTYSAASLMPSRPSRPDSRGTRPDSRSWRTASGGSRTDSTTRLSHSGHAHTHSLSRPTPSRPGLRSSACRLSSFCPVSLLFAFWAFLEYPGGTSEFSRPVGRSGTTGSQRIKEAPWMARRDDFETGRLDDSPASTSRTPRRSGAASRKAGGRRHLGRSRLHARPRRDIGAGAAAVNRQQTPGSATRDRCLQLPTVCEKPGSTRCLSCAWLGQQIIE